MRTQTQPRETSQGYAGCPQSPPKDHALTERGPDENGPQTCDGLLRFTQPTEGSEATKGPQPIQANEPSSSDCSRCSDGSDSEADSGREVCRICFQVATSSDELVSDACSGCRGSSAWVHYKCLEKWYCTRGDWLDLRCPTCKRDYVGDTAIKLARIGLLKAQESDPMSLYHGIALTHLANNLRYYGAPKQAKNSLKLLERALQIMASDHEDAEEPENLGASEGLGGWQHGIIVTSGSLAIVYGKLGMTTREVEMLKENLTRIENSYGMESQLAAVSLSSLGKAYGRLGQTEEQQKLLEQALKIRERIFGHDHLEVARSLTSLSIDMDDLTRKQQLLERALRIMLREIGVSDNDTQFTINKLILTYGRLGNTQKQRELQRLVT